MNYRAEIDGLRAIAVVSVILYHAQIIVLGRDWFEGGFIGVDIFFVISGYLISRIILNELSETSKFSFMNFYDRRARRILPMLIFIIAVCMPFAWQKLLPLDLVDFSTSAMFALAFGSNFFFYLSAAEYGADSALLWPLLHTWSLGVEEQFYIAIPIILLLCWRWSKNSLPAVLFAMFLLSIQFSDVMSTRNTELNFYLPFSRFWELLIGSMIAFVEIKYGIRRIPILSQTLPLLGLFLVAYGILFFDDSMPHPSFHSLVPIIGVSLIIALCTQDDLVGKVLSAKPLVGVGLISYSLYLWHFPIFAFSRVGSANPLNYDKLEWIVATFILSTLTYFLIEKPFRNRNRVSSRAFYGFLKISFIVLFLLNFDFVKKDGYANRVPPILLKQNLSERVWETFKQDGEMCFNRQEDFCSIGKDYDKITVYAFGDSHFASMSPQFVQSLASKFNYVEANVRGCPFVLDVVKWESDDSRDDSCTPGFQELRDSTIRSRPSIILIGGRFPMYLTNLYFHNKESEGEGKEWGRYFQSLNGRKFENEVADTVKSLLARGHQIILIYPIPEVGVNVPGYILQKSLAEIKGGSANLTTSYDVYKERTKSTFELFDSLVFDNVHRVYPHTLFCDNQIIGRCVTHDESDVYYADDDHPSAKGSEMIVRLIMEKIEAAERKIRTDG